MDDASAFFLVAALIATAGLWWFRMVLKDWLLRQSQALRWGVYAIVWLAYFTLIILLQKGAA